MTRQSVVSFATDLRASEAGSSKSMVERKERRSEAIESESPFVMGGPNGTVMKMYGELQQMHATQRRLERRLYEWIGSEQELLQNIQEELRLAHVHHQASGGHHHRQSAMQPIISAPKFMVPACSLPSSLPSLAPAVKRFSLRGTAKVDHGVADLAATVASPDCEPDEKPPAQKGAIQMCKETIHKAVFIFADVPAQPRGHRLTILVKSMAFDSFWAAVILANAIFIGVHVEYKCSSGTTYNRHFETVERLFTALFLTELLLRIGADRWQFFYSRQDRWWNWFDLALVVSSIAELVLSFVFTADHASQARLWKILKMQKLARLVRMFRFSTRLRVMMFMICESLKNLAWFLILICCILFTVSIAFAEGAVDYLHSDDKDRLSDYKAIDYHWGSLLRCIYSLYLAMTNGISWGALAEPLFNISPWLGIIFLLYVSFAILALMNIVTAVFVDGALQKAAAQRDMMVEQELVGKKRLVENLREIFYEADQDASGGLTRAEFCAKLDDERVQAYMHALHIHYENPSELFGTVDDDGDGVINIDDFVGKLVSMKGSANAADIKFLISQNRDMLRTTRSLLQWVFSKADPLQIALTAQNHHIDPKQGTESLASISETHDSDVTRGNGVPTEQTQPLKGSRVFSGTGSKMRL